ncbi:MAG TPA: hypothetical protein VF812_05435 [Ktedonobacterales bacterium]
MGMVIVLAIASILFFSVILIVAALMLRGQWDKMGMRDQPPKE